MTATHGETTTAKLAAEAPTYVYGVTRAGAAERASDGVGGAVVESIVHRKLAALVSTVPSANVRARRRDLLRHAEILQKTFDRTTVVPLRFGTVFASGVDVVDDFLEPRHDHLVDLLARLDGLAELTVRAFYDEDAVMAEIVREDKRVSALRDATQAQHDHASQLQLGEAVAASLNATRERDARDVVSALQPLARDAIVEAREAEMEVLRAAFLIERDAITAFDAKMDELARRRAGVVNFKYTGPLPPHHFVTEQWDS
jgi:hypothetical protein